MHPPLPPAGTTGEKWRGVNDVGGVKGQWKGEGDDKDGRKERAGGGEPTRKRE